MRKDFKVITINGIRGVIAAIFVVMGLIAGFVISPGLVCMTIWNNVFEYSTTVSTMNLLQGIMLWAIIALSLYALNDKKALIGFGSYPSLTPEQVKNIMERAKKTEAKILNEIEQLKKKEEAEKLESQVVDNPVVEEKEEVRQ